MILIFVILFTVFAVRCDDFGKFFVVQMPEGVARTRSFQVYWNVPTIQCKSKGIPFPDMRSKYGIIQNKGDHFQGEQVTILYDPGRFPALLQNGSEWVYRNGGVPQEGDLDVHLKAFQQTLERAVPETFKGVGIIDFESWRPIFRQNFGSLSAYKDVSYDVERRRHRFWPQSWIQDEAVRRFEEAGRRFMQSSLELVRKLRPRASWGYYGFPYCFNMSPSNKRQECASRVPEENDRMSWLWDESTALFPSLYSSKELTSDELQQMIRRRILEAKRVRRQARVLPYFWYRYRDGGFINEKDLQNSLATLYKSSAAGMMLWGSSNDVNTKSKCLILLDYVEKVLGPAIARYTKLERTARRNNPQEGEYDEIEENEEQKTKPKDVKNEEKHVEETNIENTKNLGPQIMADNKTIKEEEDGNGHPQVIESKETENKNQQLRVKSEETRTSTPQVKPNSEEKSQDMQFNVSFRDIIESPPDSVENGKKTQYHANFREIIKFNVSSSEYKNESSLGSVQKGQITKNTSNTNFRETGRGSTLDSGKIGREKQFSTSSREIRTDILYDSEKEGQKIQFNANTGEIEMERPQVENHSLKLKANSQKNERLISEGKYHSGETGNKSVQEQSPKNQNTKIEVNFDKTDEQSKEIDTYYKESLKEIPKVKSKYVNMENLGFQFKVNTGKELSTVKFDSIETEDVNPQLNTNAGVPESKVLQEKADSGKGETEDVGETRSNNKTVVPATTQKVTIYEALQQLIL